MADAVASQTLLDGERIAIMKFTNSSDGTGETNVVKVNPASLAPSAAGGAPSSPPLLSRPLDADCFLGALTGVLLGAPSASASA